MHVQNEFLHQCIYRIEKNTPRIEKCLQQLTAQQVWERPNASSNSIGNLLLHLQGNIAQYILTTLGGQPAMRNRQSEFDTREQLAPDTLLSHLVLTVREAVSIIRLMDEESLLRIYAVQDTTLSGVGIIVHVTEHYSYHTGQIAFYTKALLDTDLGFYAGRRL